jgi:hypothetical protein
MVPKASSVKTIPYASKVVKPEDASKLLSINEDIDIRNANTVVPYEQANNIVIRNPTSIAVGECACRLARDNHCEPMGGLDGDKGIDAASSSAAVCERDARRTRGSQVLRKRPSRSAQEPRFARCRWPSGRS